MSARSELARQLTLGLGVTSDQEQDEIIDAYRAEILREATAEIDRLRTELATARSTALAEAVPVVFDAAMLAASSTGERVGVSKAVDVLRSLAAVPAAGEPQ